MTYRRWGALSPVYRALSLAGGFIPRRLMLRAALPCNQTIPRRLALRAALLLALALLILGRAGALHAQTPNQAGLVILHGDGTTVSRCISFESESISGYELLERSGLEMRTEVSGMGPTLCAIDGEGCAAGEHCFCRCLSSSCEYWSYWRLEDDGWRYSNIGAGNTTVTAGVVDAWVWSEGSIQKGTAHEPPDLTLDAICQAQTAAQTSASSASEPEGAPQRTAGSLGLLLVIGAPILVAVGWWLMRQARPAPVGQQEE